MAVAAFMSSVGLAIAKRIANGARARHAAAPGRAGRTARGPRACAVIEGLELRTMLSAYNFHVVAPFAVSNGNGPRCTPVLDSAGDLFGTAEFGGAGNEGTVYEIGHGTSTITTLAVFSSATGTHPEAGVVLDSNGDVFGTTYDGGTSSDGTVFEVGYRSNAVTTLATFAGPNGAHPQAGVVLDAFGDVFGTTYFGGASNDGTVFEVAQGTGIVTTLGVFIGTNGSEPAGGLVRNAAGDLFGTTGAGGANGISSGGYGTVFEIANGTKIITTLASFAGYDGLDPTGNMVMDSSGNLFGAASGGALGDGTVFEVANNTRAITSLASFNGVNGNSPQAGVILDGSGNLFGTTYQGGAVNFGTAFELPFGSTTITDLTSFGSTAGTYPRGDLALDSSGDLWGTADAGSAYGVGNVFELTPSTTATVSGTVFLHSRHARKPPLAGVTLLLQQVSRGRVVRGGLTTTSDAGGAFTFSGIVSGTYRLSEIPPRGDSVNSPMAGYYTLVLSGPQVVTGMDFID